MTGSRRLLSVRPLLWGGLLLAGPALAQYGAGPPQPLPTDVPPSVTQPAAPPVPASPAAPAPLPPAKFDFHSFSGPVSDPTFGGAHLDYGGLRIDADQLQGDVAQSKYVLTGHVFAHDQDSTLRSDRLLVNGLNHLGFSEGAFLTRRPFTILARRIDFQPGEIVATQANVTTAKPTDKNPDIGLLASTLVITPVVSKQGVVDPYRQHLDMRDAKLYLLHNHVLTLRHYQTTVGTDPKQSQPPPRPTAGYSGFYGPFIGYSSSTKVGGSSFNYGLVLPSRQTPQLRVSGSQLLVTGLPPRYVPPPPAPPPAPTTPTLQSLRALTTAPGPGLPPSDPLLFHNFLPDASVINPFGGPPPAYLYANERLAYNEEAEGRGISNIYVTRSPEVTLTGAVPLTRNYALPTPGDPAVFRRALRRFALYLGADADLGQFHEQPTQINAFRQHYTVRLFTQPLLIAPNTLLLPVVSLNNNRYSSVSGLQTIAGNQYVGPQANLRPFSGSGYAYTQYLLALNHYFSNYSAVGVQYTGSQVRGDSPFDFDALDSNSELDGRLQVGDRNLAVAGGFRYDLVGHRYIDYTLTVAPGLRGLTPVLSYRFISRTYGITLAIPGLTF